MITETEDLESCEVHSDAGRNGIEMKCPNCNTTITFAINCWQWWDTKCQCGEWELIQKAVLEVNE